MARRKTSFKAFQPYESAVPGGNETPYIRLTKTLLRSEAYVDLTPLARNMYTDMLLEARGKPEVIYTQKMAIENLNTCKASYKNAIKQLSDVGFITLCPRGAYAPSKYKFSDKWHIYRIKNRDCFNDTPIKKKQNRPQPQIFGL